LILKNKFSLATFPIILCSWKTRFHYWVQCLTAAATANFNCQVN